MTTEDSRDRWHWKFLFVLLLLMAIPGMLGGKLGLAELKEKEFLELIFALVSWGIGILGLVGLFGVAFGKKVLTRGFWKVFAWIFGLDLVVRVIVGGVELSRMEGWERLDAEFILLAFLVGLPFWFIAVAWVIAIFSYARDPIWVE